MIAPPLSTTTIESQCMLFPSKARRQHVPASPFHASCASGPVIPACRERRHLRTASWRTQTPQPLRMPRTRRESRCYLLLQGPWTSAAPPSAPPLRLIVHPGEILLLPYLPASDLHLLPPGQPLPEHPIVRANRLQAPRSANLLLPLSWVSGWILQHPATLEQLPCPRPHPHPTRGLRWERPRHQNADDPQRGSHHRHRDGTSC